MRNLDEIKKDIDLLDDEMIKACFSGGIGYDTINIRSKRDMLENELCLASCSLVASSDELDIYEQRKYKENYTYYVALHNTFSIVGFITANYGEYESVRGNVGYETYLRYRGHSYARKALELLCDVFIDKGMDVSVIVIYPDNIPSIKTTEGFGGILVKEAGRYGANVYNVDLKQKVKSRNNK